MTKNEYIRQAIDIYVKAKTCDYPISPDVQVLGLTYDLIQVKTQALQRQIDVLKRKGD